MVLVALISGCCCTEGRIENGKKWVYVVESGIAGFDIVGRFFCNSFSFWYRLWRSVSIWDDFIFCFCSFLLFLRIKCIKKDTKLLQLLELQAKNLADFLVLALLLNCLFQIWFPVKIKVHPLPSVVIFRFFFDLFHVVCGKSILLLNVEWKVLFLLLYLGYISSPCSNLSKKFISYEPLQQTNSDLSISL